MDISSLNNLYAGQNIIVSANSLKENSFATMLFEIAGGMNLTEPEIEESKLIDKSDVGKYIFEDSEKKSIKYENMYIPIFCFKPINILANEKGGGIANFEPEQKYENTTISDVTNSIDVTNLISSLNFDRDKSINFTKDIAEYSMVFDEDVSEVSEKAPESKYIVVQENQEIGQILNGKDEISKPDKIISELTEKDFQFTSYIPTGNIITVSDESSKVKNILPQVKDKIIIMSDNFSEGEIKSITMQLQPQNLGKISIKLTMNEDKLIVEIKSENKETQKILSSNISELKEMLDKTSSVEIFVKPYDEYPQNYILNQGWQYEQAFYQGEGQKHNQGQNQEQNRHSNFEDADKSKEFSELINFGIKEDMFGN